jgi:hypothetical protein
MRFFDGSLLDETISYRNLGKNGEYNKVPFILDARHVVHQPTGPEGSLTRILLPAPIKRGDVIEFVRVYRAKNAFRGVDEAVAKRILFPINQLSFELWFPSGSVGNVAGTKSVEGLPEDGGFHPVEPLAEGNRTVVRWTVKKAKPNEKYTVSWHWQGTVVARK